MLLIIPNSSPSCFYQKLILAMYLILKSISYPHLKYCLLAL